jgi:hypothetical protein
MSRSDRIADEEVRRLALVSLQRGQEIRRSRPRWKPPLPLRLLSYLGLLLLAAGVLWVLALAVGIQESAY